MTQLYEKIISPKGKTTYRPHVPTTTAMVEIEQDVVITMLASLTMSMLISVSDQIKSHSRAARNIAKVQDAVKELVALNVVPLDEKMVTLGGEMYMAAINHMQKQLLRGK